MDDEAGGATVYLLHDAPSALPQRTWLALPSTAAAALTAFCGLVFLALAANRLPASASPASAMPTLISANTNAASIMVGERGAEFVLGA